MSICSRHYIAPLVGDPNIAEQGIGGWYVFVWSTTVCRRGARIWVEGELLGCI